MFHFVPISVRIYVVYTLPAMVVSALVVQREGKSCAQQQFGV